MRELFNSDEKIQPDAGSLERFQPRPTGAPEGLSFRLIADDGHFTPTVYCPAGTVTVLLEDGREGGGKYRAALLGRAAGTRVEMCWSGQVLHSSEVYVHDSSAIQFQEQTVRTVLATSHFLSSEYASYVSRLGLARTLALPLESLSPASVRLVIALRDVLRPYRVMVFDSPFAFLTPAQSDILAELFADVAKRTGRTTIITGVSDVPSSWLDSPVVRLESPVHTPQVAAQAHLGELVSTVRESLTAVRGVSRSSFDEIVTRPQQIFPNDQRVRAVSSMRLESIPNYKVGIAAFVGDDGEPVDPLAELVLNVAAEPPLVIKRRSTGKLTRVGRKLKMLNLPLVKAALFQEPSPVLPDPRASLPNSVKLRVARRAAELRTLAIVCGLALGGYVLFVLEGRLNLW